MKLWNPAARNTTAVTLQTCQITQFLSAFAKLKKATISFVTCFHPSAWNSAPTGWIFMESDIWGFSVEKIQVPLKSGKNKGYFTRRRMHIFYQSPHFCSEWEMFRKEVVENIKTHFVFSNYISKIVPFMRCGKILSEAGHRWQYGACALHARYLRLQIHTLRLYNIRCFPLQQWLHERASMLRYTYIACLVNRNFKTSK